MPAADTIWKTSLAEHKSLEREKNRWIQINQNFRKEAFSGDNKQLKKERTFTAFKNNYMPAGNRCNFLFCGSMRLQRYRKHRAKKLLGAKYGRTFKAVKLLPVYEEFRNSLEK